MIYVTHNTLGSLEKILLSGYLLPSIKTKNVKLFGHKKGSPYIYLSLLNTKSIENEKLDTPELILDTSFLIEQNACLNRHGWTGECD